MNDQDRNLSNPLFFPVIVNGMWGYIDQSGDVVIDPQFVSAQRFFEGRAGVAVNAGDQILWGFIDSDGQIVVEPEFDSVDQYRDSMALVVSNKKRGYVNHSGKLVIPPKFNDAFPFSEDRAFAKLGRIWAVIDKDGEGIFKLRREPGNSYRYREGYTPYWTKHGWGFADPYGGFLGRPVYSDVKQFHEGLGAVQAGGPVFSEHKRGACVLGGVPPSDQPIYWGFINKEGLMQIPPQFSEVSSFHEGYAVFARYYHPDYKDGAIGYTDDRGNILFIGAYTCGKTFSEGMAAVGNHITPESKGIGYIDKTFKYAIDQQFKEAGDFQNGLASVRSKMGAGIIDKSGNWVIDPKFEKIHDLDGNFRILKNLEGTCSIANKNGDIIWEAENDKGFREMWHPFPSDPDLFFPGY